ncbi:hypothetical protein Dimus_021074 [Dionaea muscipula]
MEALSNRAKLGIQNENFETHYRKAGVEWNTKNSKACRKQKDETCTRKPLGDLTNKSSLHPDISSKKTKAPKEELIVGDKEELNIREEGFLHDHNQCIKAQHAATSLSSFLDLVLPKYDSLILTETLEAEKAKVDPCSPRFYPKPEEMYMPDFPDDFLDSTTPLDPPHSSPIDCDFLLLQHEPVELLLKDE